jgi:cell wall assembly regulator SMI1
MSHDLRETWTRIETALVQHVPETAATLAPRATEAEIAELEAAIGLQLPDDYRQSLQVHNGQIDPSKVHHLTIEGLLASTRQVAETWRMLTEIDDDFRRREPNWDSPERGAWWDRHWVPFTIGNGDCLCINLNPVVRPGWRFAEIVCHINSNPHEPGIAASYGDWLKTVATKLESGDFAINEWGYLELYVP